MRVLQRYTPVILGVLLVGIFLGMSGSSSVSAERNQFGKTCWRYPAAQKPGEAGTSSTPDDVTYFPFGFYCGTHPQNDFFGFRGFEEHRLEAERVDDSDTRRKSVPAGTTLGFTIDAFQAATGFPVDRNGNPRDLMMWVVIDGNDDVIKSISGGGGTADRCPGGDKYGTVYGYRHESGDGKNISPFAYAGGSKGRVTCDSQGRMIRWHVNSSSGSFSISTNVNFNVETFTNNNPGGQICAREYISVNLPGDSQHFPPPNGGGDTYIEQNVTASHIVKRSKAWCYYVQPSDPPQTPPPSRAIPECTRVTVKQYRYGASGYSEPGDGAYGTSASPYPVRYRVVMSGVNGNAFYNGSGGAINASSGAWVYTGSAPAGSYNAPYTFNYTPGNNNPGGIVVDFVDEQYRYTGPTETSGARRVHDRWYPVGGGSNLGAVSAGPCYAAACTIDQIESNAPGDKVRPGSTVIVRARIVNLSIGGTPLYNGLAGHPLALENNGDHNNGGAFQSSTPSNNPLITGQWSSQVAFTVTAPASGTLLVGAQPAYLGLFGLRPGDVGPCTASKQVYRPPVGGMNGVSTCQVIYGWAFHPEAPSMSITVALSYINSAGTEVFYGNYRADVPRPDVNAAFGIPGDHGFAIPIDPMFQNGLDQTFIVTAKDDFGVMDGSRLTVGMIGCGKFHLEPSASGVFNPSDEDPATFTGTGTINPAYPGWAASASRPELPGTGSYYYDKNGVTIAGTARPFPHSRFTPRTHTAETINVIPPIVVGDRYCLKLTVDNAAGDGYIQRDGVVLQGTGPVTVEGCQRIENKPFQKVYGSAVSAGGAFKTAADGSCTGGGTGFLGGWFNNTYGGTYHYGASTELSALAMVKTVGFASAQTVADRSPTELSFANNVAANKTPTSSTYSPGLGGGFEGAACIEPLELPTNGVTAIGTSVNVGALSGGAYSVSGNTTINGGVLTPGADSATTDNITILVNGDVRINSNITYGGTSWRYNTGDPKQSTTPSFVLKATGNIYISNNVTVLDGQYVAQPRADGSGGGNLYTCAASSGWAPMAKDAMFDGCKNQLTVHGAFVADKVRLMRTYGTLRNEKPTITAETTITETINRSRVLYRYACGSKHTYSVQTSISGCTRESALGGILPTQSSDAGRSSTAIYMWTDDNPSLFVGYGFSPTNGACSAGHRPVGYVHNTGNNTYLYSLNPAAEAYGYPVAFPVFCLLPGGNQGGEVRTTTVPSALVPPASLPPAGGCSNAGVRSSPRETCAAEVFEYTPELHLSTPALRPENGDGAKPFDAITSLPPVL